MKKFIYVFAIVLSLRGMSEVAPGTGLQISASGDLVGTFGSAEKNKLEAREAEVILYAPIDQLFDGVINLAAHQEDGQAHFEIHELYIGSSKLIPRSRFRAGQYFLGLGRLNQFHRHDWPFTSAPKVQAEFFSEEGVFDTGLEYSYLFPTPFYLDLTLGLTNGWTFGDAVNEGTKPHLPTHYARLVFYNALFSGGGMQTGLNYLGRKEEDNTVTSLLGIDLTAKWKEATALKYLFQNEFWLKIKSPKDLDSEKTLGFYIYPQYGLLQNFSMGMRFDGFHVLNSANAFEYAIVPNLTYKASEFSTIRLSYSYSNQNSLAEIQGVFILGAHPTHDF